MCGDIEHPRPNFRNICYEVVDFGILISFPLKVEYQKPLKQVNSASPIKLRTVLLFIAVGDITVVYWVLYIMFSVSLNNKTLRTLYRDN